LPRNLAKLNSRLAGRDIAVPLSCGATGQDFILRVDAAGLEYSVQQDHVHEIETAQAAFLLEADGDIWEIRAWGRAVEALLTPPDGLNAEDIPAELKPAILALALEPLLDRASLALGHGFRMALPSHILQSREQSGDSSLKNPGRESFVVPFTLTAGDGKPAGAGFARMPLGAATLSALADLAKAFPRRPPSDCSTLPLSLSLCAAREAFPVKILREAEPGDVLCFSSPAQPALTLEVNGRALWTASLMDGKITIQGILNQSPNSIGGGMPPGAPQVSGGQAPGAGNPGLSAPIEEAVMSVTPEKAGQGLSREEIDALEILLTLELDERRITVGELAALGPGRILDTAASLDAPISIKAGGKTVGKGRLVEVGGNLGVLITTLSLDNPSVPLEHIVQDGDKGAA
jgi:type III secretion system YscQ/HrcQ family protein